MTKIGFIGLGAMGKPMSLNLLKKTKGNPFSVFDIDMARTDEAVAAGAKAAKSVEELAADSDLVFTMLPNTETVEAVFRRSLLPNLPPGSIYCDMSTINPLATDKLFAHCAEKSIGFVDAPVGRLVAHAERGESLFMVGGREQHVEFLTPYLQCMGSTIHYCGKAASGIRTKLVNNYLAITSCQLNAEALTLSQALGLDLETTLKVIHDTTATNGQLKINWPNKVLRGDTTPGFTIALAHKDLSLILGAANSEKLQLPFLLKTTQMLGKMIETNHGRKDFSALVDIACENNNVPKARLAIALETSTYENQQQHIAFREARRTINRSKLLDYFSFVKHNFKTVRAQHPKEKMKDIRKRLAEMWRVHQEEVVGSQDSYDTEYPKKS